MNKHIEQVKKWLDDPSSVTIEELQANAEASVYAAKAAEAAAEPYSTSIGIATYYVIRYEELTK